LLIEIAVLVSIPMLAPPGSKLGTGAMRYLIFQTMALPFILFTGWMLTGLESGSTDVSLPLRAGVLLGLGFGFLLAVFPFYSWIPLLAEENQPFISGFIFLLLPCVVLFFGVSFLDQYAWIADASILYVMLRLIGTLMIVTGGLLAAFQNHLGRIFGYAVIVETGYLLLSVGLGIKQGFPLFCTLLAPRAFGFGLWAFALSVLAERCGGLEFKQISGAARRYPITVIGLFITQLSLMGLPLLADFPVKLVIWQGTGNISTLNLVWVLLGVVGMATAALRSLPVLLQGVGWQVQSSGNRIKQFIVLVGALILISVGLFPQFFFPAILNLMQTFPHLL
jgi:formate hydrogenlyase subunit 3/multisubunit Na+/H+ antiporter MnhD subunit